VNPRVYVREAGSCTHPEHVVLGTGRFAPMRFPSLFAVIVHPRHGVVLYDTGYSERFLDLTRRLPAALYSWVTPVTLPPEQLAHRQLERLGLRREDVRTIVISHFHADHVAALRDFPRARFVYHRAAWDAVRRLSGLWALRHAFLPELVPADLASRSEVLDDGAFSPLPALGGVGRDLFGDGTTFLVPLPGHAAGQLGLYVEDDRGRRLFLVADAAWTLRSAVEGRVPHFFARLLFHDARAYHATLGRLGALHRDRPDLVLVPSHCERTLAQLAGDEL
jgi:glyoxylase-like metal-dependent hydrolase (beta-lactamase superfamily II)